MKLAAFDRATLWIMNALLLAVACPLWVVVLYLSTRLRSLPLVGW